MKSEQLREWESQVADSVLQLRRDLEIKEEELKHIQRLRELQNGKMQSTPPTSATPRLPKQTNGRVSIAPLHPSYLEWNGRQFRTPGDFLDAIGEPHYFSQIRGGQSDAAQRKILTWAKKNRSMAMAVKVALPDGSSFSLWDIADANR